MNELSPAASLSHSHSRGTAQLTSTAPDRGDLKLYFVTSGATRAAYPAYQPQRLRAGAPSASVPQHQPSPEAPCTQRRGGGDGTLFQVARKEAAATESAGTEETGRQDRAPRGATHSDRAVRQRVRGQDLRELQAAAHHLPRRRPPPSRPLGAARRACSPGAAPRPRRPAARAAPAAAAEEATAGGPAGARAVPCCGPGGRPGPAGRATVRWPSGPPRCPSGLERSGPAAPGVSWSEDAPPRRRHASLSAAAALASGESRGHGRVSPSAALRPGGSAAASSTSSSPVAAASRATARGGSSRPPPPPPFPPPPPPPPPLPRPLRSPAARRSGRRGVLGDAPPAVEPDPGAQALPASGPALGAASTCREGGRKF